MKLGPPPYALQFSGHLPGPDEFDNMDEAKAALKEAVTESKKECRKKYGSCKTSSTEFGVKITFGVNLWENISIVCV